MAATGHEGGQAAGAESQGHHRDRVRDPFVAVLHLPDGSGIQEAPQRRAGRARDSDCGLVEVCLMFMSTKTMRGGIPERSVKLKFLQVLDCHWILNVDIL